MTSGVARVYNTKNKYTYVPSILAIQASMQYFHLTFIYLFIPSPCTNPANITVSPISTSPSKEQFQHCFTIQWEAGVVAVIVEHALRKGNLPPLPRRDTSLTWKVLGCRLSVRNVGNSIPIQVKPIIYEIDIWHNEKDTHTYIYIYIYS